MTEGSSSGDLKLGEGRNLSGVHLGPYRVLDLLGAGGMGEVWRAQDERLGRDVAIKVLPASVAGSEDRLLRFEREARATAALSHPNILAVFDVGSHDGAPYIVTELLEGETLRRRLVGGPLPLSAVLGIGESIVRGLAAAHAKRIVHLDLKPENVFITTQGVVKILDFGLARLIAPEPSGAELDGAATVAATDKAGVVAGTAGYMAPEQMRGGTIDHRADIFAFGCLLYEMMSGQQAFRRETVPDTISATLHEDPPALDRLASSVSAPLATLIRRCVEKRPEDRFSTAHDLALALAALSAPERAPARPATTASSTRPLRRALLVAGIAGSLLTVLLVVFLMLRTPPRARPTQALAVLPLANLTGDPNQEYFADGMTESLIAELSKFSTLKVISRTSVMRFKSTRAALPEVAKQLGADLVVEGSVLRGGGRVRVTAQLIDAASDHHLWADAFDREARDVLVVQSDLARAVASSVHGVLAPGERARIQAPHGVDPEAHDLYLRGRYLMAQLTPNAAEQAIAAFEQALAREPDLALAYAALAHVCFLRAQPLAAGLPMAKRRELFGRADAEARRALALDATLSEPHWVRGMALWFRDWGWATADRETRRAVELNPSDSGARSARAVYFTSLGRRDDAVREISRALELDPLSPTVATLAGELLSYLRDFDGAEARLRRALELEPAFVRAHYFLGSLHGWRGDLAVAISQWGEAQRLLGVPSEAEEGRRVFASGGEIAFYRWELDKARPSAERGEIPFNVVAFYCLKTGRIDEACTWLERAVTEREGSLLLINVHPNWDPIRSDPRFVSIVRRVGIPGS